MKSLKELTEYVNQIAWSYRHLATSGVMPVSVAKELLEEIRERDERKLKEET